MKGMSDHFGVLTIAYGKPEYLEYAKALARSMDLHCPDLPKAIVTCDEDQEIRRLFPVVIPVKPEYGPVLQQKLHMDLYSPFRETMYIDSDSLVIRDLRECLPLFDARDFAVVDSHPLKKGDEDWWVDLEYILNYFNLPSIPRFNGGFIWFKNSQTAKEVFETARSILAQCRELRFHEIWSSGPNDEPIFSVAMAIHKIAPVADKASVMQTPDGLEGDLHLDVLAGECWFRKKGERVSPAICHLGGEWIRRKEYKREALKLKNSGQ